MAADPREALEKLEREVEELSEGLAWSRVELARYRSRRDAAELEARTLMAKLAALDEEEKTLRARFLNDPFWEKQTPLKRDVLPEVREKK